jgi:hypothetical protein
MRRLARVGECWCLRWAFALSFGFNKGQQYYMVLASYQSSERFVLVPNVSFAVWWIDSWSFSHVWVADSVGSISLKAVANCFLHVHGINL